MTFYLAFSEQSWIIFELEILNQIGFIFAFLLAPFILIINSFILKKAWQKVISFYLAIIFILIISLYLLLQLFYIELTGYKLVARFDSADKYVYSVYESEMISFGSDGTCRYLFRHQRIIPGLLWNTKQIYGENNDNCFERGGDNGLPDLISIDKLKKQIDAKN